MVLGNTDSTYCFDCSLWCNATQQSASALILTDVVSLTALNNHLRDAGFGDWKVNHWQLVPKPASLQPAIAA
jgi:hypothetical protein